MKRFNITRLVTHYHIYYFDKFEKIWDGPQVSKIISNIVISVFIIGILATILQSVNIIPLKNYYNPFFAIELAFNALLIFEVLGLLFIIPKSIADAVAKQFEIISLILLRDAFKEFGHFISSSTVESQLILNLLPIIADAFGSILLFLIAGIFYRQQRHIPITKNEQEKNEFIILKKMLAIYLGLIFFIMGAYDIYTAVKLNVFNSSMKLFYTLLIFTDVFVLLFSLRYNTRYSNLFRYSSFALATIFLRFSLSSPPYFNVLLSLVGGCMALLVTEIYNRQLSKEIE